MTALTREQLEKRAKDRRMETRKIEGIGEVNILRLSGKQARTLSEYQGRIANTKEDANQERFPALVDFQMAVVWLCLADANGNRLYGDDELDALCELPNDDIAAISDECLRVNGMAKGERDEIAGKSAATNGQDSHSSFAAT